MTFFLHFPSGQEPGPGRPLYLRRDMAGAVWRGRGFACRPAPPYGASTMPRHRMPLPSLAQVASSGGELQTRILIMFHITVLDLQNHRIAEVFHLSRTAKPIFHDHLDVSSVEALLT